MKKPLTIILIIGCIAILVAIGWFWLLPGSSAPVTDKIKDSLPFGSGEGVDIPTGGTTQTPDSEQGSQGVREPIADLFQLAQEPVAGFVALNNNASTTVRYTDRATGHIYDINLENLERKRVSNKTLPKIYEAHFRDDGSAVLYRSLSEGSDVVDNLSLVLTAPTSTSTNATYTISATALRGDIGEVVVGSGNTLYYSLKDAEQIVSSNFSGAQFRILFRSAFTDWRIAPYGNNLIIYTKASSLAPGYAYTLSPAGNLSRILGPLNGLVVKPDRGGTRYAYSYVSDTGMSAFAGDSSGNSYSFVSTIVEKCVWSDENRYLIICGIPSEKISANEPDDWYQGITHFSDRIWAMNINTETSEILVQPKKTYDVDVDVYKPALSPNEDYLVFINKRDLSLWALRLR